ncbi:MAG: chitobiase/beta-hexosaminidase C-terminal domain-containing protein [Bacteroidetes bacterium]|nr:chitobiase/beta-hexosaminidase C-terminal domain-containing protein [Bacteroidota bacterium]
MFCYSRHLPGFSITNIVGVPGNSIRYTVDGSQPNIQSMLYIQPISIDSSTVIKATSFSNDVTLLPSNCIGNTYIINYNQTLPVFSLSTEPENFFDWNTGIYVSGPKCKSHLSILRLQLLDGLEIPALVEYFDTDGTRKISQRWYIHSWRFFEQK